MRELAYSFFTGQLQGKLSPFSTKPFRGNAQNVSSIFIQR